jgi:hypothetical protein
VVGAPKRLLVWFHHRISIETNSTAANRSERERLSEPSCPTVGISLGNRTPPFSRDFPTKEKREGLLALGPSNSLRERLKKTL